MQTRKRQSWQTKRAMCSRSRGVRSKVICRVACYGSAGRTGRRLGTMTRERHGHQSGWSAGWLPLEPTDRWRGAIVLYIPGAAEKYDVRLQEKYRKRRTENPRRTFSAPQDRTEEKRWRSTTSKLKFASERTYEVSRSNNNFQVTRDNRNQESNQSSMDFINKKKTGVNIEIVSTSTQASLVPFLHWHMPLEHGPSRMNSKKWSDRHNARCFVPLFRQSEKYKEKREKSRRKEDNKRWRGSNKRWKNRRKKSAAKTLKERQKKKVTAQK